MKKGRKRNGPKLLFWLMAAGVALFLIFVPPLRHASHNAVTVKVHPTPEEKPVPPPQQAADENSGRTAVKEGGEEKESPEPPPSAAVIIPVSPQKLKPIVPGGEPKIAIVIDDVGMDLKGSARAINLPATITLSFLPYAPRLRDQTKDAREKGHELLLHMPMEPLGHEDPGPGALLVDLPMRDLQERFETALASFTGFDGVNNHMGSKFTAYSDGMTMVVEELQQRHLFYFDSRTSANSVGKQIAEQKGLPTIARDVFLDDEQNEETIRAQLEQTERIAQKKGYAVAIGHPHAMTMKVLEQWVTEAGKQGYELVPLDALVTGQ